MPYDPNDSTPEAILDRLEHAKEVYQNGGQQEGVDAADRAIDAIVNQSADARQTELDFNRGDFNDGAGDLGQDRGPAVGGDDSTGDNGAGDDGDQGNDDDRGGDSDHGDEGDRGDDGDHGDEGDHDHDDGGDHGDHGE